MHNARFRLLTATAGATMCLFAAAGYAQNTNTTTGTTAGTTTGTTGSVSNQSGTAPTTLGTQQGAATTSTPTAGATATTPAVTPTDNNAVTPVDNTTTTTTTERRGFPWGLLGLLGLLGLMKRGDTDVVRRDTTYATTGVPGARNVGTGSAADDRMNLTPRAASGTGTGGTSGTGSTGTGGINDPNSRR